jgi:hypothetical protein
VEPAPSTVTVRVPVPAPTKGLLPIIALLSLTVPPFSMMSTPDPVAPTTKLWPESVMVHVEPGPFTVTVPKPGTPLVLSPIELSNTDALLTTLPPFSMVSVPVPARPTLREELMVQMVEPGGAPAPFTVTAPEEPALSPISAPLWRIGSPGWW